MAAMMEFRQPYWIKSLFVFQLQKSKLFIIIEYILFAR